MSGQDVYKLFAKMNHAGNQDWVIFQPRIAFRAEGATLKTFGESYALGALWFMQQSLMRIMGEIRGFGKFGIRVEDYYHNLIEPSEEFPYGRYYTAAVKTSQPFAHKWGWGLLGAIGVFVGGVAAAALLLGFALGHKRRS